MLSSPSWPARSPPCPLSFGALSKAHEALGGWGRVADSQVRGVHQALCSVGALPASGAASDPLGLGGRSNGEQTVGWPAPSREGQGHRTNPPNHSLKHTAVDTRTKSRGGDGGLVPRRRPSPPHRLPSPRPCKGPQQCSQARGARCGVSLQPEGSASGKRRTGTSAGLTLGAVGAEGSEPLWGRGCSA